MSDLGLRAYASQEEEYMPKSYSPKTEAVIYDYYSSYIKNIDK